MFKRKLFKRALPIILSVAMVFQSAPTTAFAAEGTTEPETVIEETTDEIVVDDGDDNEAADGQDDGANEESAPADNTGTEESKSLETQTTEETKTAETQTAEENRDAGETQAAEETSTEEAVDNAEAALDTQIVMDESDLKNLGQGISYDSEKDVVYTTYSDEATNPFKTTKDVVKQKIRVEVDGVENENLKDKLAYKWQVKGADGYADMAAGNVPVDAGAYRLVITMPKVDGVCNEAEAVLDFEIKKQELTVFVNFDDSVKPGTKVSEVIKEVEENYEIGISKNNLLNKDTYVSKVTVTVKNSVDNTELSADTELLKTGDYSFNMTVELTDSFASNYAVKEIPTIDITMETAPETEIKVDILKEEAFGKTYDGSKIADPVAGTDYKVQVVYGQDEEGKDLAIAEDKLKDKFTYAWIEDDKETELKEAPVDAGTYYYQISYAGEDGLYAESEILIEVVIEPASIYIVPVLDTQQTFYAGMSEDAVLDEVDYKVFDTKDGKERADIDRETFWGVSYNNTTRTQSFEPVFKLQVARAEKDQDGNYSFPKDKDGNVVYNYVDNNGAKLESPEKAVYRIVFSGKKTVYSAEGTPKYTVDINRTEANSAETNYAVDVKDETITKNAVAVEIKAAKTAVIDVTALYKLFGDTAKDKAGESFENPNVKTYDNITLYDLRDDYKKAVVTADGKELAKNNAEELTYVWEVRTGWAEETDKDGKVTKTPVWGPAGYNNNGYYWINGNHTVYAPYDAGDYRLAVSYSNDEYAAEDAYVYYTIEQQKVAAVPSGEFTQPYGGTSIADFTDTVSEELKHGVYKIAQYTIGKNNEVKDEDLLSWTEDDPDQYDIQWVVERALKNPATGELTGEYEEVYDKFILGEKYRLGLRISWVTDDYAGNYRFGEEQTDEQGNTDFVFYTQYLAQEINPVQMGNIELEVVVDEAKLATTTKVYDGTPFDISEDIKNGFIRFYTKNGADAGREITGEELEKLGIESLWECQDWKQKSTEAVNGGQYKFYLKFTGNDTFAPINNGKKLEIKGADANELIFEITKREITATSVLNETITAGDSASSVFAKEDNKDKDIKVVFGGDILEAEKADFVYGVYTWDNESYVGYKATKSVSGNVLRDGEIFTGILRSSKEYEAQLKVSLAAPYDRNYNVTCTKTAFTPVRGQSTVTRASGQNIGSTALKAAVDNKDANNVTYTITPREGIPFSYTGLYDEKSKKNVLGNYFALKIQAPKEFNADANSFDQFIYENSIQEADGHVLATDKANRAIIIAFEASAKDKHTFKIRWEDNYVETFVVDFTDAVLEDNLTKAVAPKSLAFNNPNKKMVAGETQQLDVKVIKVQLDDVICLDYQVDNTEILSVTDKGYLTALQKGSATVTVIPSYLDDTGEKVAIQGAKTASVKISVVDVTAPKIKTVKAYDTYMDVTYPVLNDGYRREIYVLEGKNVKPADFETAISSVKNGAWQGIFAIAPIYGEADIDSDPKTVTVRVNGLSVNTEYTVYVRNVSGIRTLDDGTRVVASKAGAAKGFKTTLAQVDVLSGYFDTKTGPVYYDENKQYEVKLSDKSAQLLVQGRYPEINGNQSADDGDNIWYALPLAAAQQQNYANPKLSYAIVSDRDDYYEPQDDADAALAKKWGYTVVVNGRYYKPTKIATINKSGKIALKGVGYVYIYAYDSVTGIGDWTTLYITATTDKVTAKNIKLKVGETAFLSDYLTFYEGNKKLTGYVPYDLYIEDLDALNNEYFSVEKVKYDYVVVAKKPGGTLDIKVADLFVQEAGGQPATLKVQSSAIDPVKNLKAEEVRDTYFTLKFSYKANGAYSEYNGDYPYDNHGTLFAIDEIDKAGFRIELRDSSNKLIKDEFISLREDYSNFWVDDVDSKGTATFGYQIRDLTRLSSYKVSVTAVFGTEQSKIVSKTVKTTNIPASSYDMNDSEHKGNDGGMEVSIGNTLLGEYRSLVSNNTYTLIATGADSNARTRLTDTLTWKSSNTKVATVKANAGTYTATLKALKKGSTTIEVTSKITKKVIARWTVFVNATGEAGSLYGDLEPNEWDEYDNVIDESNMDVLTVVNPVKAVLGANEAKWAVFKAPAAYGCYTFRSTPGMLVYDSEFNQITNFTTQSTNWLYKNEKLYFYVKNAETKGNLSASIWVSECVTYDELTFGTPMEVNGGKNIVFFAPETNYYTFYADQKNVKINGYSEYSVALEEGDKFTFTVSSNGVCNINVKKREPADITTDGLTDQKVTKNASKWYAFEAPADGEYVFKSTDASANISAKFYTALNNTSGTSATPADKNFTYKISMQKGQVRYFEVTTTSETDVTYKLSVAPTTATVELGKPQKQTIEKAGEKQWFSFQAPEDGTYNFRTTVEKVGEVTPALTINYNTTGTDNSVLNMGASTRTNGTMTQSEDVDLDKGEIIYISVSSNTDASKVTINVTDVEAQAEEAQLVLDTDKTDDLSALDAKWYTFTAPKKGIYTITAKVAERVKKEETPGVQAEVTVGSAEPERRNFPIQEELYAGEKVTLKVYTTDDKQTDKVTLRVSELKATEFADNKVTVTNLADKDSCWVAYKVPADNYYEFTAEKTGDGTVTVKRFTSIDLEATGSSFTIPCAQNLQAGDVIYLKITAAGAVTSYTITAKAVDVTTLTTSAELAAYEIPAKGEKWFKFTAAETAKYQFTSELPACVTANRYGSFTSYEASAFYGEELSIDAGKTWYFKLTNGTEAEAEAKLKIAKVEVKDMTADKSGSATLKNGQSQWFVFTAPESGRYEFTATASSKEGTTASASFDFYNSMYEAAMGNVTISSSDKIIYIRGGQTVYVQVTGTTTSDEGATVTLKTDKLAILGELDAAKENPKTVAVSGKKANEYVWVEFMVPEDGVYTFSADGAAEGTSVTAKWVKNTENQVNLSGSLPVGVRLTRDTKYTIGACANIDNASYTLKVTKRDEEALTVAKSVSKELKAGDELWINFKVPETGRYAIKTTGLGEGVTASISGKSGNRYNENTIDLADAGFYYTFVANASEKMSFRVTTNAAEAKTITVVAEPVVAADFPTTGTATIDVTKVAPGELVWYQFTAPEDGCYQYKVTGDITTKSYVSTDSVSGELDEVYSNPWEMYVHEGVTDVFAVYYGAATKNNIAISMTKVTATELTEAVPAKVEVRNLIANEKRYISFVAPADGRYIFTKEPDVAVNATRYDKIGVSSSSSLTWGTEYPLKKGEELLFAVSAATVPAEDFNIKVSHVESKAIAASEEAAKVELTEKDSRWLVFTADKAGKYQFEFKTESGSTNVYLYDSIVDSAVKTSTYATSTTPGTITGSVSKGGSVYFKVGTSGAVALSVKTSLTQEMTELTISENTIDTTSATTIQYAYFTAAETGVYKFKVNANSYLYCSEDINFNTEYYVGSTSTIGYVLDAGDTLYFKEYRNRTGTITIEKTTSLNVLAQDVEQSVAVDTENYQWLSFTAAEAGDYMFTFSNSSSAYVYTRSFLGNYYYDEEYFGDYDNSSAYYLNKNETIYIAVKSPNTATTSVSIKAEKVTIVEMYGYDSGTDLTLDKGEVAYIQFCPEMECRALWMFGISADQDVSVSYARYRITNSYTSAGTGRDVTIPAQDMGGYSYMYIKLTGTQNNTNVSVSAEVDQYILNKGNYNYFPDIPANESETYMFTAQTEEQFSFIIWNYGSNVSAELRDADGNLLASGDSLEDSDSFSVSANLDKWQTVYLTIKNNTEDDFYPEINVFSYKDYGEMTLESPVTASLSSYGYNRFYFTPKESGYYVFTASLYNDDYYYIEGSVSGLNDESCSLNDEVFIQAGQKVYLTTHEGSYNSVPSYTVNVHRVIYED